jgi:hypothetical protein
MFRVTRIWGLWLLMVMTVIDERSVDAYAAHADGLVRFAAGLVGPSDAQDVVSDGRLVSPISVTRFISALRGRSALSAMQWSRSYDRAYGLNDMDSRYACGGSGRSFDTRASE